MEIINIFVLLAQKKLMQLKGSFFFFLKKKKKKNLQNGNNSNFLFFLKKKKIRVCVKTLPKTLILHLKRFEFDMETLKRLKINDYYEFPTVVNMEPYTLEYLTKQESNLENQNQNQNQNGTETQVTEYENIPQTEGNNPIEFVDDPSFLATIPEEKRKYYYKLVGILVHTGTADSGHYYSFIKERTPRFPNQEEKKWLQFNDSNIDQFNFKDIPQECFGGFEYVSSWDSSQMKNVSKYHTKPYSAYMLFYESLTNEDIEEMKAAELALQSTQSSQILPIASNIQEANEDFLRDKFVFSETYFNFVFSILQNEWKVITALENPNMKIMESIITMSVNFFIYTLSHAKDRGPFNEWIKFLISIFHGRPEACTWFLTTLIQTETLSRILLQCHIKEVQVALVDTILAAISVLRPSEKDLYKVTLVPEDNSPKRKVPHETSDQQSKHMKKEGKRDSDNANSSNSISVKHPSGSSTTSIIAKTIQSLFDLLNDAPNYWRNFETYFSLLFSITKLGWEERSFIISISGIAKLLLFYLGDEVPYHLLPPDADSKKKRRRKMGDKFTSPPLEDMLNVLSLLLTSFSFHPDTSIPLAPTYQQLGQQNVNTTSSMPSYDFDLLWCTSDSKNMANGDTHDPEKYVFFVRQLKDNVNPEASSTIFRHICWESEKYTKALVSVLMKGIDDLTPESFGPYFKVIGDILRMNDSKGQARLNYTIASFFQVFFFSPILFYLFISLFIFLFKYNFYFHYHSINTQ